MGISFRKYHGTGNDFVMIDNRELTIRRDNTVLIKRLCDRHFGIGADGVILLQNHPDGDFEMVYFNADGNESTMCGNGGRCIVEFANSCGIGKDKYRFLAIDGWHLAERSDDEVRLKMKDVEGVKNIDGNLFLDTGSPHYILFTEGVDEVDVKDRGAAVRNSENFRQDGVNVNFVELQEKDLFIRTYERGVEDETLSCGTGVTASALAWALHTKKEDGYYGVSIQTPGGRLKVEFEKQGDTFKEIWLRGPAVEVFSGQINV